MEQQTLTSIIDQGIKSIDRRRNEIANLRSTHRVRICDELRKAIADRKQETSRIGGLTLSTNGDVAEVALLTNLDNRNAMYLLTLTPNLVQMRIDIQYVTPDGDATKDYRDAGDLLNEGATGDLIDLFVKWVLGRVTASMN